MQKYHGKTPLVLPGGLLLAVLLLTTGQWHLAEAARLQSDDDGKFTGIVQSMPSGLIGDWVIGGVSFRTTASSEIEAKDGPFVVGACVEVEFATGSIPFIVDKLETEDGHKCGNHASRTPDASATPDETGTPHGTGTPVSTSTPSTTAGVKQEVKGIVSQMPSVGLVGTWVVGGIEYVANVATEFEQDDGPFVVGACVEVEYFPSTAPRLAHEIKTDEQDDCHGDATRTPSAHRYAPRNPQRHQHA